MPEWTRNTYKNGIEIKFEEKPSAQIIEWLKKDGWQWYPKKAIWYITYSQENIISAKRICECATHLKKSNNQNRSLKDFESTRSMELLSPLKKEFASIWETRFDNTPYYDIENLKLYLKRKQQIHKINRFFLNNCGYTTDELQNMSLWNFHYFTAFGSDMELSFDILYKKMERDALNLFKERYRLFFELQDAEYRQRLRAACIQRNRDKICPRCKNNRVLVQNQIICDNCLGLYGLKDELKKLDINSGVFWEYLETFGRRLQPVDRIAARVSIGHSVIESSEFMEESLKKLTLSTIDSVTKTMRPLLERELKEKIKMIEHEKANCYLCAVYSGVLKDDINAKKHLNDFINYITPQKVILDYIAEEIKPRHIRKNTELMFLL